MKNSSGATRDAVIGLDAVEPGAKGKVRSTGNYNYSFGLFWILSSITNI